MPASSKLTTLGSALQCACAKVAHRTQIPQAVVAALLTAVAPIVLCELVLKALRISAYRAPLSIAKRVALLGSDVSFLVALCAAVIALSVLCVLARVPRLGVLLAQLLLLCVFAIDLVAHGYFRSTGLVLDYSMFAFALSRVSETAPVVASEITPALYVLLVVVPVALLAAPWIVLRRVSRSVPVTTLELTRASSKAAWLRPLATLVLSLACASGATALAFRARVSAVENSFARDPVVQLISSYVSAREAGMHSGRKVKPRKTGALALKRKNEDPKLNVVVFILESTRADATTAYTPRLRTTPFLAKLAAESTRVDRAYAVVPHTSKALVSILCGYEPRSSLEVVESKRGGLPGRCLARLLRRAGYDTAYFQSPRRSFESRDQLVRNLGYAHFVAGDQAPQEGLERINYLGMEDAVMLKPSDAWLQTAKEPFFATYLTNATHHPYGQPKSHVKQRFTESGRKNDYLNAIRYVDGVMAKIYAQYEARGLIDRTVFVVVGDHGEGFGEHGLFAHDDVLYEEGIRVPLLFRVPSNQKRPSHIAGPVNQLSIVPTLLDVLGYKPVGGSYEERSVYATRSTKPLFLACYRKAQCAAMIRDHYKLTYYFEDKPTQMFDLRSDPEEKHDIAASRPALVKAWSRETMDWVHAVEEAHRNSSARTLQKFVSNVAPRRRFKKKVTFGNFIEAQACSAKRRAHGWIHIHCLYKVVGRIGSAVKLRVYARAENESRIWDHAPVSGLYPLREWKEGEYITDDFPVNVRPWTYKTVDLCIALEDAHGNKLATLPEQPIHCMPMKTIAPAKRDEMNAPAAP